MEHVTNLVKQLNLNDQLTIDDIPAIDLYVDQVIQLFENKYKDSLRNDDEKVITKTMINNYAKGRLFFPIKNKKYSQAHLMMINLIYQLKGSLSISDIKTTLNIVNKKIINDDEFNFEQFYNHYLTAINNNAENLNDEVAKVFQVATSLADQPDKEKLDKIILILSLVNLSNTYRRLAEKLVDELQEK